MSVSRPRVEAGKVACASCGNDAFEVIAGEHAIALCTGCLGHVVAQLPMCVVVKPDQDDPEDVECFGPFLGDEGHSSAMACLASLSALGGAEPYIKGVRSPR